MKCVWFKSINITGFAARCPVPTLVHGTTFPLSTCSGGQCTTNDHIVFTCEPDYCLSGNGYITCVGYREWDLPVPTCEGKSESMYL